MAERCGIFGGFTNHQLEWRADCVRVDMDAYWPIVFWKVNPYLTRFDSRYVHDPDFDAKLEDWVVRMVLRYALEREHYRRRFGE